MSGSAGAFEHALLCFDRLAAEEMLRQGQGDRTPIQIVDELIVPALESIGEGWGQETIALAQV